MTVLLFAAAMTGAAAQTAYDALLFSEKNYEGTARTMAMGNAFTALGGDMGSIVHNPAGSAVAGYSQISITPSITISSNTAQGVSPYTSGELPYFQKELKSNMTGFSLPNFGVSVNFDTHRTSGIKNITFGFIANCTGYWNEDLYANGTNQTTSFMGSMAVGATEAGFTGSGLNADDAYNYFPWKDVVGYQSGMISTFGGHDDQFVGASEMLYTDGSGNTSIEIGGPLDQTYGRRVSGSRYDYLINFGANVSDFLYFGANIGITSLNYAYNDYFRETAVDPSDFALGLDNGETMYFQEMKYKYSYKTSTAGVYGKFGIIVTPGAGLRFGAAIQTPTRNIVEEEWQHAGETVYTDPKYDLSAKSPYGEDGYTLVSPFRANFGVAWTLGKFAVISADYEMCNYGQMKFKTSGYGDSREYFEEINEDISDRFGVAHMLRAGIEIKPVPVLAIRAGYDATSTSEQYNYNGDKLERGWMQNAAVGLGFSSKKSFFADIACRYRFVTEEYFMPYSDYIFAESGNPSVFAPEILNKADNWKVVLTLGWRF